MELEYHSFNFSSFLSSGRFPWTETKFANKAQAQHYYSSLRVVSNAAASPCSLVPEVTKAYSGFPELEALLAALVQINKGERQN